MKKNELFITHFITNSRWLFLQWSFIGWATKLKNSGKQKKGIVTRNKVFFFIKLTDYYLLRYPLA